MANFVVGTGVADAMKAAQDEPRSDEIFYHSREGVVLYSETQGRDAIYRWTPQDGVKRLPLA